MDDSRTERLVRSHHGDEHAVDDGGDEMEAAHLARLRASHALTMSERLARTHELCAQLSRLRPIERGPRDGS